ncbi:MAG: ribonuclease P protein component [Candidatus Omnitrophica bacterium]|nr:ribonuclease P protein component [Candidatus Omnitrophota bacterium]
MRPEQRLRTQASFKHLVDKGCFARGVHFYAWTVSRDEIGHGAKRPRPALGVIVSRRAAAKATRRNAYKRRIREIFRKHQGSLKQDAVCLIKVRPGGGEASFEMMELELIQLFKKTGAWS